MATFLISLSRTTPGRSSAWSPMLLTKEMRHVARQRQSMLLRMAAVSVDQLFLNVTENDSCLQQRPTPLSTCAEVLRPFDEEAKPTAPDGPIRRTASAASISDQVSRLQSPSQQDDDLICSSASLAGPASALTSRLQFHRTRNNAEHIEKSPKILPPKYELCAADDIVALVAHMLAELITTNDATFPSTGAPTRFHSMWVDAVILNEIV